LAAQEGGGGGVHGAVAACLHASEAGEDARAEVMAALVAQLPALLPELEVLVLPIRLPGGR
jgi:hypothetical protein